MKKNNIRTKAVKDSLLEYESIAKSLRENTESAVKSLLSETVKEAYAKILSEDEDKDYEEEEVEDTVDTTEENGAESQEEAQDALEDEPQVEEETETEVETETEPTEDGEDEWAEFEKYKVGEDEYDFNNAKDDEIVKVYKLMKNGDQVVVTQDDDKVHIQDNEAGTEYLVSLGDDSAEEFEDETNLENDFDDMNESQERLFELVLEYDSNVGYTDKYQKKDVMTNPGMSEPAKGMNDWDAGVPHGTEKPFSGYKGGKKNKADKPFNAAKGKTVEEELDIDQNLEECGDVELEEGTNVGGFVQQNTTSKSHIPTSNGRKARNASKGGVHTNGTPTPRYATAETNEAFTRKLNKIVKENKQMMEALGKFRDALKEASVVNYNLGQIINLISENSTTKDEKREIISRFNKEARTIEESKNLYNAISRELKKAQKMDINEDKQIVAEGSKKINETTIYKDKDVLNSLDLMHRMMR